MVSAGNKKLTYLCCNTGCYQPAILYCIRPNSFAGFEKKIEQSDGNTHQREVKHHQTKLGSSITLSFLMVLKANAEKNAPPEPASMGITGTWNPAPVISTTPANLSTGAK